MPPLQGIRENQGVGLWQGLRHPSANIWRATGLTKADLSKKYNPWFIWGQLNTWFKQDIYDPSATLSAARRGTISLPDIESCYFNSKARYNRKVGRDTFTTACNFQCPLCFLPFPL